MALSQKEVRERAGGVTRVSCRLTSLRCCPQADIQMMLAAQCHLGTKCAPGAPLFASAGAVAGCAALAAGLGF